MNYKAYLLQLINLIQKLSFQIIYYLVIIGLLGDVRSLLRIDSNDPKRMIFYGLYIIELITIVLLIIIVRQIATRISITGKKIVYVRSMMTFILVGINLLYRLYYDINIQFFLLSIALLIGVLEYYDTNPAQKKSMILVYIGVSFATLLFSFGLIGDYVLDKYPVLRILEQVLGLATTLGIGLPIFSKAVLAIYKRIINKTKLEHHLNLENRSSVTKHLSKLMLFKKIYITASL